MTAVILSLAAVDGVRTAHAQSKGQADGQGKSVRAGPPPSRGYTGAEGPTFWGYLSHEYAACASGRMQSPIAIVDAVPASGPALVFDYEPSPLTISNNGRIVQVEHAGEPSAKRRRRVCRDSREDVETPICRTPRPPHGVRESPG